MEFINAFVSGLLTYVYLITENWYWIFGIGIFVACSIIETKEVSEEFEDDERTIL